MEFLNFGEDKGRQYTVVETGCSFPLVDRGRWDNQPPRYRNDTVIQDKHGKVVLIHSGFLKLADPPHVWRHGDVMTEADGSYPKVYIHESGSDPRIFHLCGMRAGGQLHAYLATNPVFLFNIKDKI